MSKPINAEHEELLGLRSALIGKPQAIKQRDEITRKKNAAKFTLIPPKDYQCSVPKYSEKLIQKYEEPILQPYQSKASEKAKAVAVKAAKEAVKASSPSATAGVLGRVFLIILLLALGIGALCLGIYLIYISAVWSWNSSISSSMNTPYLWNDGGLDYTSSVIVHLLSLCLCFAGLTIIFYSLGSNNDDAYYIGAWISGILACLLPIVSVIYYYSVSNGFWEGLLYTLLLIPAFLIAIPKVLFTLIYTVPFFLALAATVLSVIWIGYLVCKSVYSINGGINGGKLNLSEKKRTVYNKVYNDIFWKEYHREYNPPKINYSPLYNSKEYKDAQEREEKELVEMRNNYQNYFNAEFQQHNNLIKAYNEAIAKYNTIINNCNAVIQRSNLLNDNQKDLKTVNIILYYFDCRRARTVTEALNVYNTDLHQMRMEQKLDDIQRTTTIAINEGVRRIENQLDAMQTAISRDIASVNSTLNSQTATIEKALEKMRRDNERHANMIADEQRRTTSQLGYIGNEVRLDRLNGER